MNDTGLVIPIEGRKKKAPTKRTPKKILGNTEPRLHTAYLKGKSRAQEVSDLADRLGMPLLPWQRHVLEDAMRVTPTGEYRRKLVGTMVARQQGKTHMVSMRIIHGLLNGERVIGMSSDRGMALELFREVADLFTQHEWLAEELAAKPRMTNGDEMIKLKNGARYSIIAATRSAPRGKHADFVFVDELREVPEEAWVAVRPLTRATGGVTWTVTNAGDIFSTVLNDLRERALSATNERVAWYEYSAEMPVGGWNHKTIWDRKLWAQANPALGYIVDEESLAESVATNTVEATLTEMLCVPVDSQQSPWPLGVIEDTSDKDLVIEVGRPTIFGFDVSPSKKTGSLVIGSLLEDGRVAVGIVQTWRSEVGIDNLKMASEIFEWYQKYRPTVVAYDRYATADIAVKLAAAGVPLEDISGQLFYQACSETLDAFINRRLVHNGEPTLIAHLNNCAMKTNDAGWRLIRRKSAGDISGAIGLCMVIHEFAKPQSTPTIVAV